MVFGFLRFTALREQMAGMTFRISLKLGWNERLNDRRVELLYCSENDTTVYVGCKTLRLRKLSKLENQEGRSGRGAEGGLGGLSWGGWGTSKNHGVGARLDLRLAGPSYRV